MADVFVSYAREDLAFVRRLTAALQARNREVWVDLEDIIPSAHWMEEIRTGITEADAVVFVITPDSVASKICRTELDYATEQSKRLVPILARETPAGDVPSALAELHWLPFLDGTDFEAGVDRLVEVLDTDLPRAHLHTRLLVQASEWENRRRDRSLLLRGGELKQAETWLADQTGRKPAATPAQAQLILASRRAVTRRQRGFGVTGVAVLILMAILTTVALIQRQTAIHQRQIAITRELTTRATVLAVEDPEASMRLAIEAFHQAPTGEQELMSEARSTLLSTQAQDYLGQLVGHTSLVTGVMFSPDGHTMATCSDDGTALLWDAATHRQIATFIGHNGPVFAVAFSPDGHTLATASDDDTARLWDVATHQPIATLIGHTNNIFGVAFSPDGHTLATASRDGTTRLWDVASGRQIGTLTGHPGVVSWVAFSPNGHTLATAGAGNVTQLWEMAGEVFPRPPTAVAAVAFSPDGRILATGSNDGTARLWDVPSRTSIATLTGHSSSVDTVAFSPDGRTLATGSADQSVRLWEVSSHRQLAILADHTGVVSKVVFSPDGRTLATASRDRTVRLWNVTDPAHPISLGPFMTLTGRSKAANAVNGVVFSPDGRTLAAAVSDGTARLWDVASRRQITTFIGHNSPVFGVAFSPDGQTLATSSFDNTVRLWKVASHTSIAALTGHTSSVLSVAFSPDGRTLATGSSDRTVRLWDVAGHTSIAILTGHVLAVSAVTFSPDGHRLATASTDGTVRLWDPDTDRVTARLCHIIGTPSRAEWERLIPDLPYQPTCP